MTYEALTEAGVVRTAAGTSLPEIGSKGYYTVVDSNLVTGDEVIVKNASSVIVGGGENNPPVILSSDGLDSISTDEPSGLATNFREMVVQFFWRFFGKVTFSSTQIKTYRTDESTVATTQTTSETDILATQGKAS